MDKEPNLQQEMAFNDSTANNGDSDSPDMRLSSVDIAAMPFQEQHEIVQVKDEERSPYGEQGTQIKEIRRSNPGDTNECNVDGETAGASTFLSQPLSFCWRKLKWGLILSLGRNDAIIRLNKDDLKAAVATQLEVAIMGSALVLTLGLQIQEVVGSRGGFTLPERERERLTFVSFSALSFSFAFYSIIISAMILLSINAVPQSFAEGFLQILSSWTAVPRSCTLAGAFCLGIAALMASFLGLESSTAWVGVAVIATAVSLTTASAIMILIRVRQLQAKFVEETSDSKSMNATESRLGTENSVFRRKFRDADGSSLSTPVGQPILTPLTSLSNTTGFSFRASRFH